MPKAMENKLKAMARKRGYRGKRANAFVYGTMRKTGWMPKHKKMDMAKAMKMAKMKRRK